MSRIQGEPRGARLIGAPPGYVGYDEGGQLTEAVRRKPYSVVLFDEIEKAHPDVFNVLLQVLDDGRLTDGRGGRSTSEHGHHHDLEHRLALPARGGHDDAEIVASARRVPTSSAHQFRPEFLNRVDETVLFKPLTRAEIERIVVLQLEDVRSRLAERRVSLDIDEEARRHIARKGFDPVYGARPLRRFIAHDVETRIARALLAGEVRDGSTITVRVDDGELVVSARGPSDQEEINNTQ